MTIVKAIMRQKLAKYRTQEEFEDDLYKDRADDTIRRFKASILGALPGAIAGGGGGFLLGKMTAARKPYMPLLIGGLGAAGGAMLGDYIASRILLNQQAELERERGNIAREMYLREPIINKGSVLGYLGTTAVTTPLSRGRGFSLTSGLAKATLDSLVQPEIEKRLLASELYRKYKDEYGR
jgi:hypothetical protein